MNRKWERSSPNEVFSLRINPRLVVLSACESGLGKLEGGNELQGLNRAFLYAGAGGVVSSLWTSLINHVFFGNPDGMNCFLFPGMRAATRLLTMPG